MPIQQPSWKPLLAHHISLIKPPTFSLATVASGRSPVNPTFAPPLEPPPAWPVFHPTALVPRVRTMIYRGFLCTLPENKHNPLAEHNPPNLFSTDCITFTTDSRSTKTGELMPDHKSGGGADITTGGGAQVEACFWIASDTTTGEEVQNQWRVRGRCYLLAEEDVDSTPEVTRILEERMVESGEDDGGRKKEWTWKKEVQRHFGNLAPSMRGSFANPPPGTPLSVPLGSLPDGKSGGDGKLKKGVPVSNEEVLSEEGHAARARRNFRVGVILPEVVERVDLNEDDKKARRWVWWKVSKEDEKEDGVEVGWKGIETWP